MSFFIFPCVKRFFLHCQVSWLPLHVFFTVQDLGIAQIEPVSVRKIFNFYFLPNIFEYSSCGRTRIRHVCQFFCIIYMTTLICCPFSQQLCRHSVCVVNDYTKTMSAQSVTTLTTCPHSQQLCRHASFLAICKYIFFVISTTQIFLVKILQT